MHSTNGHYFEKDSVKRRVRGRFTFRVFTLTAAMLFVLVGGCLGRVAYIMTVKGEEYRTLAADNLLRNTIMSMAMNGAVSSMMDLKKISRTED